MDLNETGYVQEATFWPISRCSSEMMRDTAEIDISR